MPYVNHVGFARRAVGSDEIRRAKMNARWRPIQLEFRIGDASLHGQYYLVCSAQKDPSLVLGKERQTTDYPTVIPCTFINKVVHIFRFLLKGRGVYWCSSYVQNVRPETFWRSDVGTKTSRTVG